MIRFAIDKDVEDIMRLLFQVNNVHAAGRPDLFVADATKYKPSDVLEIIADDNKPVFVFTDDNDKVIGYCFCIIQDHTSERHLQPVRTLYIDDLCVDEKSRGKHIGKSLYRHVRDWAKENGFHNITLNVWNCNPDAMVFYRNLGLVPQKTTLETLL